MNKREIPVFDITQNCDDKVISNFKVASFNEITCTATEFEENHRHEYFEIIWLKNGEGSHQIDLYEHQYKGSVMFVLAPGQIHKIDQSIPSEGYVIKFLPSIFENENDFYNHILDTCLFDSVASCPVINVPDNTNTILDNLFQSLMEEFNNSEIDTETMISSYLKILVTHINRIKRQKVSQDVIINDPHYSLYREFKIAVEKNYKKEHSVNYYAELLSTQSRALNSVSRKYVDKSAGEVIKDRILLEAKRSLYHETKSIKELCFDLGFEDPAYFTRFFKKYLGVAPQYFKEQNVKTA